MWLMKEEEEVGWHQDHRQDLGRLVQSQLQAWLSEAPAAGPPRNPGGWPSLPCLTQVTGLRMWPLVPWQLLFPLMLKWELASLVPAVSSQCTDWAGCIWLVKPRSHDYNWVAREAGKVTSGFFVLRGRQVSKALGVDKRFEQTLYKSRYMNGQ